MLALMGWMLTFGPERVVSKDEKASELTARLRMQKENIRDAFLTEIREAQKKQTELQNERELEERQRRERKEREKDGERSKQEQAEDVSVLKQLLSTRDSSHLGKSTCIAETRVSILNELAE